MVFFNAVKCSEMQRNAAKCWLNADKFFPDVGITLLPIK